MDAQQARLMIWEELLKVGRPDSKFSWEFSEFIADYEGSEAGARHLAESPQYQNAQVVFVTPDNNLETFRQRCFEDGKTVVMTNYGITRGFFLLRPGDVPAGKEEVASLLDGVSRYWHHHSLAQLAQAVPHIDLLVTGASAITPGGIRFGKGHGYFDLEWAMLHTVGLVSDESVIVAAGHDCQVVDVPVEVREYDTAIDYIVTPSGMQKTRNEYPRPTRGIIWGLLAPGMREQIPPVQELWCRTHCK